MVQRDGAKRRVRVDHILMRTVLLAIVKQKSAHNAEITRALKLVHGFKDVSEAAVNHSLGRLKRIGLVSRRTVSNPCQTLTAGEFRNLEVYDLTVKGEEELGQGVHTLRAVVKLVDE